jgi:hypothetical protein
VYAVQSLTVLPPAPARDPLCRAGGHTCAGCCWGEGLSRPQLAGRIRRHTRLFHRLVGDRPARWRLLLHELAARRGADLFWALLLLVPGLGGWLRGRLVRRTCCAFVGFEDAEETRVGCLLHPARWEGRDERRRAFGLLPGFGCGPAEFYCLSAYSFLRAPLAERRRFLRRAAGLDWFAFSRSARGFRAGGPSPPAPLPLGERGAREPR